MNHPEDFFVVYQPNQGAPVARNRGIKMDQGNIIDSETEWKKYLEPWPTLSLGSAIISKSAFNMEILWTQSLPWL